VPRILTRPGPDALFEGICGLVELRYKYWIEDRTYAGWNTLIRHYFRNVGRSFGLTPKDHKFKLNGRTTSQMHGGLLWEGDTTEVAAIAWHWRTEGSTDVLSAVLKEPAPLKVYLTDPAREKADDETARVRKLITECAHVNGACDFLGVVFVCAKASKSEGQPFAARLWKVVANEPARCRDILKWRNDVR
jgi:hypothetical protein